MKRLLVYIALGAVAGLALGWWLWRPAPIESDDLVQAREDARVAREEAERLDDLLSAAREQARIREQQAETHVASLHSQIKQITSEREILQAKLDELASSEQQIEPVANLSDDQLVARLVELTETQDIEPLISVPRPAVESAVMSLALARIQQQQLVTLNEMYDGLRAENELLRQIISEREQQLAAVSDERELLRQRLAAEEQFAAQQEQVISQLEQELRVERTKKKAIVAAVAVVAGLFVAAN